MAGRGAGNGYDRPLGEGMQVVKDELKQLKQAIRDLQQPSGTNVGNLYDQVQKALANIRTTVIDAINELSLTVEEINALVANPPYDVEIGGDLTVTGTANFGGRLTANPGITSTDIRNRQATSNYAVVYVNGNGDLCISSSTIELKKDVQTYVANFSLLMAVRPVLFRFKSQTIADDRQPGFIAEELIALGLDTLCYFDDNGDVLGVNYERMVPLLVAYAQAQHLRSNDLEARISALEGNAPMAPQNNADSGEMPSNLDEWNEAPPPEEI